MAGAAGDFTNILQDLPFDVPEGLSLSMPKLKEKAAQLYTQTVKKRAGGQE